MPTEDDDPVIASYNVFISPQPTIDPTKPSPKLYVLQYPSHRPQTRPYTSSRSQKPTALRIKPETGIFEIDIPLFTSENYNSSKGHEYGKAMYDSKQHNSYTSHGLSGGFSQNAPSHPQAHPINLSDVPQHNDGPTQQLTTQVLGGKVAPISDRNPVYMLAAMNSKTKEIHLTHIDGVVQLRPQLHHIDALEDQKRRAEAASRFKHPGNPHSASNANDVGSGQVKLETKAIEMKVKDASKEDPNRSLNVNAKLLREIQGDRWLRHDWIEPPEDADDNGDTNNINEAYDPPIQIHSTSSQPQRTTANMSTHTRLKSALDNDEWLNKMSSPGIELRTRLKGRDRERARRKRQERLRAAKADGVGSGHNNNASNAGANIAMLGGAAGPGTTVRPVNSSGSAAGERTAGSGARTGPFADDGSASETASASGSSDDEDDEDEDHEKDGENDIQQQQQQQQQHSMVESPRVKIKQESSATGTVSTAVPAVVGDGAAADQSTSASTATSPTMPKRRGRPPKK